MTQRPEPRTRTPRAAAIIATARALLETEGPGGLTMRRLGELLGMRAPSLYKHLRDKRAVVAALVQVGLLEMGEALHDALERSGQVAPVAALLAAYRAKALADPNLYRLATAGSLPRDELTPGLEDWAGEPFLAVTGDPARAQALWSFAHGMVILELDGRFPDGSDLDRTWRAGATAFAPDG